MILSSWERTCSVSYAILFFFLVWDPSWSNLTFGWWASWEPPNVTHFRYESESRILSHKIINNIIKCFPPPSNETQAKYQEATIYIYKKKKGSMLVFLLHSDLRCHKQWPLFEHSHCAGNENVLPSASLFSLQGDSTQAGVKSKLQPKQPALAFLFPSGLRDCVFWGGIWLNNKPPGGKSWGIAMAGIWLNPKPERWIIHPFTQWFGTAPETRASRS